MKFCDWCGHTFSHRPITVNVKGDSFRLCSWRCKEEMERSPDVDFNKLLGDTKKELKKWESTLTRDK